MLLRTLRLAHFRIHDGREIDFDPHITCLVGPNASGKTTIIEALHFLSTGQAIRGDRQGELVSLGHTSADVSATYGTEEQSISVRIYIELRTTIKKTYFVNNARKSLYTYVQASPGVVMFTPEMMSIIDGSPSERRGWVDTVLSKIDVHYARALRNYENGVRKRNKILEAERDTTILKGVIAFWNEYIQKHAVYIQAQRTWLVGAINGRVIDGLAYKLVYTPNEINEQRFHEYFMKEHYQARTLIGPHRDELSIVMHKNGEDIDTRTYASRGEQRMALLWLVLEQLYVYQQTPDLQPLLLLDDIFSELDSVHQKLVIDAIATQQTIITSAEKDLVNRVLPNARIIILT